MGAGRGWEGMGVGWDEGRPSGTSRTFLPSLHLSFWPWLHDEERRGLFSARGAALEFNPGGRKVYWWGNRRDPAPLVSAPCEPHPHKGLEPGYLLGGPQLS